MQLKQKTRSTVFKSLITLLMLGASFIMVVPFLWMVSSSLKSLTAVFEFPIRWFPDPAYFSNYEKVWLNEYYPLHLFFGNSVFVAAMLLVGQLLISAMAAYAFARIDFKFKNLIFILYLATMMIPHQATLVPYFALFRAMKIYNTFWALILPGWINMTAIFLLRQFFLSIPNELSESAKLDGATHAHILFRIVIPLTLPAIFTLLVLGFVSSWNDFTNPLVFITSRLEIHHYAGDRGLHGG